MITAAIVSVVGSISYIGLIVRTSSPSSRATTCAPLWLTQRCSARSLSSAATSSDAWLSPPMNYRLNSSSARSAVFSSSRSSSTDFVLGACRSTKSSCSDFLVLTAAHLPAEAPNDFRHLHPPTRSRLPVRVKLPQPPRHSKFSAPAVGACLPA